MRRSRSVARRPIGDTLEEEIAQLRGLGFKDLRARWQSMTGREAPPHLSRHLLFAIIAYRIQAEALGDLNADTVRLLKKVGSAQLGTEVGPLANAFDQWRRELPPGITTYSRKTGPSAARPSPRREKGVGPEPLS